MRQRALQVCLEPGCGVLSRSSRCEKHEQEAKREHNERNPSDPFYYSAKWRKLRLRYVRQHPLCEICNSEGRISRGTEVHHKNPRALAPELELVWSNLQTLCRACHRIETAQEMRNRKHNRK